MEPDILYHYTSLDALFSIITNIDYEDESNVSFTLRATHASFLNDLNEGRLLSEALRKLGVSEVMLWSVVKTEDIHPPKTGISVHFCVLSLMAMQK